MNNRNQQPDKGRLLSFLKLELEGKHLELLNITGDTLEVWGN